MIRTTVNLPDELLTAAKRSALDTGRTLTKVIEDALRAALAREGSGEGEQPELPTYGREGIRPGVDLDDTASLLDLIDDDG